jgi:hypothetical protein
MELNKARELSQHGVFETAWLGAVHGYLGRQKKLDRRSVNCANFPVDSMLEQPYPPLCWRAMGDRKPGPGLFREAVAERSLFPLVHSRSADRRNS